MLAVKFMLCLGLVHFGHGGKLTDLMNDVKNKKAELDAYAKQKAESLVHMLIRELTKLRRIMPRGVPSIGVPPLDPLKIGPLSFQSLDLNLVKFRVVNLMDVSMYGLRNFTINDLGVTLADELADFNVTFGLLTFRGSYQADGQMLNMFPISGSGPFEISGPNIKMLGTAKIKLDDEKLQIVKMGIVLKHSTSFAADFKGLRAGGPMGGNENGILQGALTNAFGEKLRVEKICDWAVKNAQPKLNALLGAMNFELLTERKPRTGGKTPSDESDSDQDDLDKSDSEELQPDKSESDEVLPGKNEPGQNPENVRPSQPTQLGRSAMLNPSLGYIQGNGHHSNSDEDYGDPTNGYRGNKYQFMGHQGNIHPSHDYPESLDD